MAVLLKKNQTELTPAELDFINLTESDRFVEFCIQKVLKGENEYLKDLYI